MGFVTTKNLELYVEEGGKGLPVLYISGTGGDLRVKPGVLDGPLGSGHHVIAYDQRGLGQSGKPDGPYTMEQYADDAASLLDALGHDTVDVIGVSFGGMVAQHLALRHPDRIRRLVLCCTSPGGSLPSYPFHELPEGIETIERLMKLMAVSDRRRDEAWQAANPDRVQTLIDYTLASAVADHSTDEYKRGARLQLEARAGHDVINRLREINLPTLICAGRYDGIAPQENQTALCDGIRNTRLNWYEGGHLFLIQDKQAWQDIAGFLC